MIANIIICLFLWLARKHPPRVITGGEDGSPYLTRYFLFRHSVRTEGMEDEIEKDPPRWGLYLHRFHRGDADRALHNHPWKWAVSLVLKGGYSEERRVSRGTEPPWFPARWDVVRRAVRPWTLNFLRGNTFHRVDLLDGEAWTLFLVGPIVQSWGFWERGERFAGGWYGPGTFVPWRTYLGLERADESDSA